MSATVLSQSEAVYSGSETLTQASDKRAVQNALTCSGCDAVVAHSAAPGRERRAEGAVCQPDLPTNVGLSL